jgi:hypothetical protein
MQQVAKCEGIEQKRIFGLSGLIPAETVSPEIAERIAQQFDERGRRLLALQGRHYDGMIPADQSIVGGQPPGVPVDPAGDRGYCSRQLVEFVRAGEQPIGPSRCMLGYARTLAVHFRWVCWI